MHVIQYLFLLLCSSLCLAVQQKPVVLWHGMGDDCCNPDSMGRITELIQRRIPGIFVHSIRIGDNVDEDHKAGFFGRIAEHVDKVCEQLKNMPELENGFNAVGFSQGGLFLRAYVERCNKPVVHRLITFGSPHSGVSDIPNCMNPKDFACKLMRSMVRGGVYTNYIQDRVIQAQYYRDPTNEKGYLERNKFLPELNNENILNKKYKDNISLLDRFVMIRFSQDAMIKPGYSAWFWIDNGDHELIPLQNRTMYTNDWLGLKSLDDTGRLEFLVCPGQHVRGFKNKERRHRDMVIDDV
ncbi:Alpha/Beta hydrolase protein [Gilbertella persicaria]|uniref:Alpha/Beta hydrolase protein n=1 Tax=Gilbertella persicaria TaxID=101096 RepID=UPI002220AB49|nr:Alpha/Beta hydrolase protein [Gilbertella persicaria]KAI8047582.1 Alpha/Beta hydrolase protein [Gilbertella persicaria]